MENQIIIHDAYPRRVHVINWHLLQHGAAEMCCPDFAESTKDGTDCEGYLRMTTIERTNIYMCGHTQVRFCPWCGVELRVEA